MGGEVPGFTDQVNHPCNAILTLLPVLPPVSRPSTLGDPVRHPPKKMNELTQPLDN